MKHVNYLSFFLLTLFSISFISCSDDDDNKLNTGITNQSWTEGKSLEISQDNELSVSFNAAAKWVASVTSGADWCTEYDLGYKRTKHLEIICKYKFHHRPDSQNFH